MTYSFKKESIKKRYEKLLKSIESVKKENNISTPIEIIVASKYASIDEINILYELGLRKFGENKLQDALNKKNELSQQDIEWHFSGHLQSNKAIKATENFHTIQSIDSIKLLKKINNISNKLHKKTRCLIQINSGNDPNKHGFTIEEVEMLKNDFFSLSNIEIQGIMCIAPMLENEKLLEDVFYKTQKLYESYKKIKPMTILSMGMSNDYKQAIKYGSNHIRIGRYLFKR